MEYAIWHLKMGEVNLQRMYKEKGVSLEFLYNIVVYLRRN
jgi:hypothetical protein